MRWCVLTIWCQLLSYCKHFCLIAACQSDDANISLEGLEEIHKSFFYIFIEKQMGERDKDA